MSTPRLTPDQRVPARYTGSYAVRLAHRDINGAVTDETGALRNNTKVRPGDIVHLRAHEVYGASYLFDPRGERDPQFLGVGKVVLPEHAQLSDAERAALGYEHHEGRSDFEPLYPLEDATRRFAAAAEPVPAAPADSVKPDGSVKTGKGSRAATTESTAQDGSASHEE